MNKFISIHRKIGMETKYSFLCSIIVYQTPPKSVNRGITRATNLFVFILLMKGNGFSTINTHWRVSSLAFENIYFACISIYQGSKGNRLEDPSQSLFYSLLEQQFFFFHSKSFQIHIYISYEDYMNREMMNYAFCVN